MNQLLSLLQLGDLNYSWFAKFISLIVLPFANEDLAIILGGYIVVNELMPVGLVTIIIYVGMVASDFVFYGIGVAARRMSWLGRFAVDDRVLKFADMLKRNQFEVVALCRVVPGLDLIAFIACGWMRVPLSRFVPATLVVSALYLPLMLYLVIIFGDAMDNHAGLWTWPVLLVAVAIIGFARNRIFRLRDVGSLSDSDPAGPNQLEHRFRVYEARYRPRPEIAGRLNLGRLQVFPRSIKWLKSR